MYIESRFHCCFKLYSAQYMTVCLFFSDVYRKWLFVFTPKTYVALGEMISKHTCQVHHYLDVHQNHDQNRCSADIVTHCETIRTSKVFLFDGRHLQKPWICVDFLGIVPVLVVIYGDLTGQNGTLWWPSHSLDSFMVAGGGSRRLPGTGGVQRWTALGCGAWSQWLLRWGASSSSSNDQ